MAQGIITIHPGREKSIRNQHPWIFSGAIAKAQNAVPGELVTVVDHAGSFLARGYWNPKSQIQVRILTWQDEEINDDWWRKMLARAVIARKDNMYHILNKHILDTKVDLFPHACRLINAENDFIPGLIVDRYADWLVLQALTLYIDQQKAMIAALLVEILKTHHISIQGVYERSDVDVRGKEGLKSVTGVLWGEEPPELVTFSEYDDKHILVDIRKGHKTGYYLDQTTNRSIFAGHVHSHIKNQAWHILNLFSFTGGFGFDLLGTPHYSATMPRLKIWNVDSSRDALNLARKTSALNKWEETYFEFVESDCFDYLRECVKNNTQFDVVILDPPKFAHNKQQVDKAARGYKDLNLNAFKIVKSGGYLMTFSCSGAISRDLFQKIVFGALADSGRQAQIIKHLSASDDHPVALTFPEGEYLKGLLLRVY